MSGIRMDLGEIDGELFEADIGRFITARTAVVGMSGSGKSHLIGVICEELSENGTSFVIIDPEGEYSSLKEKYEVVWAGKDLEADVKLSKNSVKKLAQAVVNQGARLILDTSDSENSAEEMEVISNFLDHFYKLETEEKRPITVIVEEADRFAPQFGGEKVQRLLEISRRGRKRGIGLMIATQRPQMVDKNVLSQCGNQLIGKLRTKNDLKAVDLFFASSERLKSLPELRLGEFYALGEFNPQGGLLKVKGRTTSSLGSTPKSKKRKAEFSVDDFVSEVEDAPGLVSIKERKETPAIEKKKKKHKIKKEKESDARASIKGVPFKLKKEQALSIAEDNLKKTLLTGKTKETIESVESVYWPFLVCGIVRSKRVLFHMSSKEYRAVLDPVMVRFLKFKEGYSLKEVFDIDDRLAGVGSSSRRDSWKDIRILKELQREDMTANDLVPKTGLSLENVRTSIKSLQKKKLVTSAGKAGSTSIYRPLVKIKDEQVKDLNTEIPSMKDVGLKAEDLVLKGIADQSMADDLIKGLFDDSELVSLERVHIPFYKVSIVHRKNRTKRFLMINGRSGDLIELDGRSEALLRTEDR
ncbi:MAG: helicase HerA domain-containing protein [Thermoplasmatota archaeon]